MKLFRWFYRLADLARAYARRRGNWDPGHALGRRGEDVAHRYLQSKGMTVVARNYMTPNGLGELDLVAYQGGSLVVVEVKTRSGTDFGSPERNVDQDKERRIIRGAEDFARRAGVPLSNVRFDVLAIVLEDGVSPEIRHSEDVFHPDENTPLVRLGVT